MFVRLWRTMRGGPDAGASDVATPPMNATIAVRPRTGSSPHKLQFAVLAEGFGEFIEPQRVTGPVVAGEGIPDPLTCHQLQVSTSHASARNRYDPTVVTRSSAPSSCITTRTATVPSAPAKGSPSTRNGPTLPRATNIVCDETPWS